jgi:hypothetical protein
MQIDLDFFIRSFNANTNTFESLFSGIDNSQVNWKPSPDKWSLLEVLCHLYDEEHEDFRYRLKHVLETPENPLPPIDPQGWVTERNYAGRDPDEMLKMYMEERKQSAKWLKTLTTADWNKTHIHPKLGPMSAGFILANWLAHDYLHFRQITRLKYQYLKYKGHDNLSYAGDW